MAFIELILIVVSALSPGAHLDGPSRVRARYFGAMTDVAQPNPIR